MNDNFNFDGKSSSGRRAGGPMEIWDMLSILVLVITVGLVLYFAFIFISPDSTLNPLRPGANAPKTPTFTPTALQLEPTWTASPTLELTATSTQYPTFTPVPTYTPFSLVPPTKTPKPPTVSPTPRAPFSASVSVVASTIIHPDITSCNWAGIGGTVVDMSGSPVVGMVVVLRGSLNNKLLDQPTVTGVNKEYGPSGFEFVLDGGPVATDKTLYVQLVDQSNVPLSDKIYISTSSDCSKNLVLVRFKKNR